MKTSTAIFLALDCDDKNRVSFLLDALSSELSGLKIGPRFLLRGYGSLLKSFSLPIFYDPKYFDIPTTVEASVQACFDLGYDWVTVHASNGPFVLKKLAKLEKDLSSIRPFKILVVTILTSLEIHLYPSHWKKLAPDILVQLLVEEAYGCGMKNFVCSAMEVPLIKKSFPDIFCVTPGIRFHQNHSLCNQDDQLRFVSPKQAQDLGSDVLIVGRPLLEAKDPLKVLMDIKKEL